MIDFEDMLVRTVELLETDQEAAELVRARYTWFSVDEYQDTNLLQEQLLGAWLGDRRELCVVGDPDQTIYTFTGASSAFLATSSAASPTRGSSSCGRTTAARRRSWRSPTAWPRRHGRVARGSSPRRPPGPAPRLVPLADEDAELRFLVGDRPRPRRPTRPSSPRRSPILVRINAQVAPLENALTRAGIAVPGSRRALLGAP